MRSSELSNGENRIAVGAYDNVCKTVNYVIDDVIIWVQNGNCKKWLERIFGAFYNITKNQDNLIQTV